MKVAGTGLASRFSSGATREETKKSAWVIRDRGVTLVLIFAPIFLLLDLDLTFKTSVGPG